MVINRQNSKILKFSPVRPKSELPTYIVLFILMSILYENFSWQLVAENAIEQIFLHIVKFWPAVDKENSSTFRTKALHRGKL